jgi:pyrroline-5-carboxylate reductase
MMSSGKSIQVWGMIGAGNMGRAIAAGAMAQGDLDRFVVADSDPVARAKLEGDTVGSAAEVIEWLEANEDARDPAPLVLAVKPQSLEGVAREIRRTFDDRSRVVISVLAGTPGEKVRSLLGPGARVVRAMPNLPASVRQGCTAICLSAGAHAGDDDFALELFRGIGPTVVRIREDLMDAFTGVVGSGPAYVFYLAEAMTRAAVELGFDPVTADRLVRATVFGSGMMVREDARTPAEMRAAVTSKGGTTAAATAVLESSGVMESFVRAIAAARDRGRELARL